MAVPVTTQVLNEIQARLANISVINGYFSDGFSIDRGRLEPWRGEDLPGCNIWDSLEERVGEGGGYQDYRLTVVIEVHDKTRDQAFTDLAAKLAADTQIALNRSVAAPLVSDTPSMALGGLVSRIAMVSYTPIIGSGQKPFCGALMEFSVTYRRKPDDPFTIYS